MKKLLIIAISAACLIAAALSTATAQHQNDRRPVMDMENPDLYLELKHRPGTLYDKVPNAVVATRPPAASTPVTYAKGASQPDEAFANYMLTDAMWEACGQEKFFEELGFLYNADPHGGFCPQQFRQALLIAQQLQYIAEK